MRVPKWSAGGGLTRSSDEVVERQWSEGVKLSVLLDSQPREWEELD